MAMVVDDVCSFEFDSMNLLQSSAKSLRAPSRPRPTTRTKNFFSKYGATEQGLSLEPPTGRSHIAIFNSSHVISHIIPTDCQHR